MINNHVCSLELSKQLVEAGVVVESEFWWFWSKEQYPKDRVGWKIGSERDAFYGREAFPAPLASELGELLPEKIQDKPYDPTGRLDIQYWYLQIYKVEKEGDDKWNVIYTAQGIDLVHFLADTEANARAKVLLYLKEKGIL